jgi:cell division septation protein DedD
MITIKPSTVPLPTAALPTVTPPVVTPPVVTNDASAPPKADPNIESNKKRIPLASIPATLSIGLLIAAMYLGGRIIAAHRPATPVAHTTITAPQLEQTQTEQAPAQAPIAVTAVQQEVKPEPTAIPDPDASLPDAMPMITPQAGERYIQVGALDPEATRRFVQYLRREKLEPHVAPGPKPELLRVLIGPFDDRNVANERQAQLQLEGIASFVRKY